MSSSFKLLNHEDGENKNKLNYINNGNQNNNFTPNNKLGLLDDILGSNNSNSEINDLITNNIGIYNKLNNTSNVVTEKKEKDDYALNMNSYNLNLNNTNSDGKLFGINDIISNDNNKINFYNNNSEVVEKQNNEESPKTENDVKDKEIQFNPKDIQGTANLNQEEGINKVNEFKLEENNNKNVTEIETKVNSDKLPENLETIENKIQSNDIFLNMLQNQIIDNNKNMNNISNVNLNNININKEEKNEINDENKKDGNLNEFLDNKKEEVEEVKKEENNNNIFTEEKKEVKDDSNVNSTMLKDIIQQNKKQLSDILNSNANKEDKIDIKNNINNDIINNNITKKEEQKEIKNDNININFNNNSFEKQNEIKDSNIFINNIEEKNKNNNNNNKKYGEKIKEKKKQLTNTVFNRLYNDGKKAKDNEKEKEKENNLKKNGKINKITKNKKNKESNKNVNSTNDSNLLSSNLLIQNFLKESKNSEILKKLEILKQPLLFIDYEDEAYSFKPEINKKSRDLVKKRLQKKKNNSPLNKTDINNNSKNDNKNKKNGSQILVNKSSINMLLKKNEHNINEIVEKYSNNNDGKLSVANTIQCLWDIHILREILKSNSKNIETIDLETIKNIVKATENKNAKKTREMEEIEFVEQLWIKINPYYKNENDFIDKEVLYKFLKILFSLDEQSEINKMITTVENFLKPINKKKKAQIDVNKLKEFIKEKDKDKEGIKENIIDHDNKDINNENKDNIEENKDIINNKISNDKPMNMKDYNNYKYISLLREKEFGKNEIWPMSKFLRAFFELKKLIYTYKNTKKDKVMEEIIKERDKELTFQPDFNATTSYFKRKSITDKKEDIQNNSMNNSSISGMNSNKNKKKHDFNKIYEEFMLKKKMHEQALMILRQNKDKKEIKMCTDRPKINKNYKIKNRKKTPEVGCSRNEFLYKLNKEIQDTKKQKILERQREIDEKETFSFMPTINKSNIFLNKNFAERPKRMPRGSEEYIKRNRSVIQFKKRQFNYQFNTDSNYEKKEHHKVNLHKFIDTEQKNSVNNVNNINNINNIAKKDIEQKDHKEYKEQKDNIEKTDDKINSQKDDVYFTIQVKTAEGYVKPLKIYMNKNPIETANNFCDINNIRKSTRDKIILNIKKLQKQYGE